MEIGDVYLVNFCYEDRPDLSKLRPAICILTNAHENEFAALKVTTKARTYDKYSIEIIDNRAAGLNFRSFIRCNKIQFFSINDIITKLGNLSHSDLKAAIEGFNDYYSELTSLVDSIKEANTDIHQEPETEFEAE